MSTAGEASLAGQLGAADELLTQAAAELRDVLASRLESVCHFREEANGELTPIPESIDDEDVDQEQTTIALVIDIEEHLGGAMWEGPPWLDAVIARARSRWEAAR